MKLQPCFDHDSSNDIHNNTKNSKDTEWGKQPKSSNANGNRKIVMK